MANTLLRQLAMIACISHVNSACADIDVIACREQAAADPNMCQDPVLSTTACPSYCKKCPLTCYHCQTTGQNNVPCTTQKTCAVGEQCVYREITDPLTGSTEHISTCASNKVCLGQELMQVVFGRRSINTRNVAIQCCSSDLCNAATTTTTSIRTTMTPTPTSNCDSSNNYHQLSYINKRFCIKIHNESKEWGVARHACMLENADLVVLDSHDKHAAMTSHLRSVHILSDIWIGALVVDKTRSFYWLNNASLPSHSTEWGRGQPDDTGDNHQHEDCVTIRPQDGFKFHDRTCFTQLKFICERTL
ncbi:uncharacterized protein LOC127880121 [Dreissena polymorpha]|uniref:C-type lectin domain-containing protein n=1 Tax=Dreissena polymorpha TaxID=45954 RepID=A0A9D4QL40_DREPO|nr:uncharacterized protein LOC127879479 [Dreissena polymorpha]XP_052283315.1 uncharacterized protein LOC127880121 [Dreissena polymorpha]KAH3834285.1 hypothetical protein DPMN_107606 [Dreissena polymorpha]